MVEDILEIAEMDLNPVKVLPPGQRGVGFGRDMAEGYSIASSVVQRPLENVGEGSPTHQRLLEAASVGCRCLPLPLASGDQ